MRMWLKDAETKVGIDEEKDTWMEPQQIAEVMLELVQEQNYGKLSSRDIALLYILEKGIRNRSDSLMSSQKYGMDAVRQRLQRIFGRVFLKQLM